MIDHAVWATVPVVLCSRNTIRIIPLNIEQIIRIDEISAALFHRKGNLYSHSLTMLPGFYLTTIQHKKP